MFIVYLVRSSVVAFWTTTLKATCSNLHKTFRFRDRYFYHFEGFWFESAKHRIMKIHKNKGNYCIVLLFRGFEMKVFSLEVYKMEKISMREYKYLESNQRPSKWMSMMLPLCYQPVNLLEVTLLF